MNPADCEQNTDLWRQLRCGFVTASRMNDVLRKPKRGQRESTSRKAYLAQIVSERLTGKPVEQEFESWDTRRGTRLEPFARAEYELSSGLDIRTVGFVEHPKIAFCGCSPDALVGDEGLAQIKCPRTHVHLDYLMAGVVPSEYRSQMLLELACTGRQWSDFVSYNQDLPAHLQIFKVRLERNAEEIAVMEAEVVRFLAEVEETIKRLPTKANQTALEHQLARSLEITERDLEAV